MTTTTQTCNVLWCHEHDSRLLLVRLAFGAVRGTNHLYSKQSLTCLGLADHCHIVLLYHGGTLLLCAAPLLHWRLLALSRCGCWQQTHLQGIWQSVITAAVVNAAVAAVVNAAAAAAAVRAAAQQQQQQ